MGRIKVIGVPRGEAPLSVREKWIGIEMLTIRKVENTNGVDVLSGALVESRDPRYVVYIDDALEALERHDSPKGEATLWWKAWRKSPMGEGAYTFGFEASVCEVLEDELPY